MYTFQTSKKSSGCFGKLNLNVSLVGENSKFFQFKNFENVLDCQKICSKTENCVFFNFNKLTRTCSTSNSTRNLIRTKTPEFLSGFVFRKDCPCSLGRRRSTRIVGEWLAEYGGHRYEEKTCLQVCVQIF